jgi:hypothetical protein
MYSVRLTADYRHGNRPVAVSAPFTIDTVPPSATIRAADEIFSPDGDGDKDEIVFDQTSSNERLWLAEIVPDGASEAIRTWELSGSLIPVTWDGTDDDGEIVPDGRYRYRVTSTDEGETPSQPPPTESPSTPGRWTHRSVSPPPPSVPTGTACRTPSR